MTDIHFERAKRALINAGLVDFNVRDETACLTGLGEATLDALEKLGISTGHEAQALFALRDAVLRQENETRQ